MMKRKTRSSRTVEPHIPPDFQTNLLSKHEITRLLPLTVTMAKHLSTEET
jgi:hypothetical protein